MKPSITNNKGFTLIEVMIAVFVLAIGLLGVAGLQLFASQNTYEANQRTTAAALASSIVERMRMNPTATNEDINPYINDATPVTEVAAPQACTSGATCTPDQLATHDLQVWHNLIVGVTEESQAGDNTGGLVAPSACITRPTGNVNEYRIIIAWRGRTPLSNPTTACGEDEALYGTGNKYRRVFFIDATMETLE